MALILIDKGRYSSSLESPVAVVRSKRGAGGSVVILEVG